MARRVPLDDPERAIQVIEQDGGVILTGFSSIANVQEVNRDAAPFIAAFKTDQASKSLPPETARCTRLFGRSTTARETWLQQESLQKVLAHFLRTVTIPYHWVDPAAGEMATNPILSAASTLDISPGVEAQDLHRDDFIWQQAHSQEQKRYLSGSDFGMGLLVAGVKTTAANGATLVSELVPVSPLALLMFACFRRDGTFWHWVETLSAAQFVPGSHLWAHSRLPKTEEVVAAEMDVGEAFVFLGSVVHAGGANTTEHSRTVHGFFYCRSYLRPEENQHLWWTREEVQRWSVAAQKQAGYLIDHPFLGYCNETDPVSLFRANDPSMQSSGI